MIALPESIKGRRDKKFCDSHYESTYQHQKEREQAERFYNKVDNQIKLNYKILKDYNKEGKVTIRT